MRYEQQNEQSVNAAGNAWQAQNGAAELTPHETISEAVRLEISELVQRRAQAEAVRTHTRLETILNQWIALGMVDGAVDLLPVRTATPATIESAMASTQQTEMADLLERRTELTNSEQVRLDELVRVYRQSLVRKAQALTDWLVISGWSEDDVNITQLARINSSMIYAAGYDAQNLTLELVFNTGGIYRYFEVPPDVYHGLLTTESKGRYMWENIFNLYPYERLRRERA